MCKNDELVITEDDCVTLDRYVVDSQTVTYDLVFRLDSGKEYQRIRNFDDQLLRSLFAQWMKE